MAEGHRASAYTFDETLTAPQGLLIRARGGDVHKANRKAVAKRRARNRAARKARRRSNHA